MHDRPRALATMVTAATIAFVALPAFVQAQGVNRIVGPVQARVR